jgi:hypothetical protein
MGCSAGVVVQGVRASLGYENFISTLVSFDVMYMNNVRAGGCAAVKQ